MDREKAIEYRNELLYRCTFGPKLTAEEIQWLRNTPVYSQVLGSEYYKMDVLQLREKTRYLVKVKCLKFDDKTLIRPRFSVPPGTNGYLLMDKNHRYEDYELLHHQFGQEAVPDVPKKKKSMTFGMDTEHSMQFFFRSDTGRLLIEYFCWVSKDGRAAWHYSTDPFIKSLAMEKKVVAENKIIYGCCEAFGTKESIQGKDWFDKFVFSVEWECVK